MRYRVKAVGADARVVDTELDAPSEAEARTLAAGRGLVVLSLARAGRGGGRARFPLLLFNQELLALLRAGIPLAEAVTALSEKETRAPVRSVLSDIVAALREGQPLSRALERAPQAFPDLYIAMIRAAERISSQATPQVIDTATNTASDGITFQPARLISTMTVAIAPGPASMGMASGTMAMSSRCRLSSCSSTVVRVGEGTDQESLSHIFAEHDLNAIPVVDEAGRMKGIVTVDDIVDVVQEEATEDIQKFGGMAALEQPYLQSGLGDMVRKRGVWLTVLLFGQMLTATVIGHFQGQIEKAAVLSIFMPLVISSGGNSGSQASTLVIRAMALGELRAADWWRVVRRELLTGLALGVGMGVIGLLRVVLWPTASSSYGPHYALIGLTVGASLVGALGRLTLVVERAARKIDHLAPPSNGAGFGPVTIDKFSLSLTKRRRGVFLTRSSSMVSWPTLRSRAAILASALSSAVFLSRVDLLKA